MKMKTSGMKILFTLLTLVMVFTVTAMAIPSVASAEGTDNLEYVENSMSGIINPQYSVRVDGDTVNMSAFNQMETGNHMFVVLANAESQKMLTNIVENGQCAVKDLTSSVYNADETSENSGSILRYVWLFVKIDDNKFQLRPAYATAGRLTVDGVSVELEDKADIGSADEDSAWAWSVEQLSDTNGALVALKHIDTDGYLTHGSDNLASISAGVSSTPALQWHVYPVFQGVNPYTVYGFAQAGVDVSVETGRTLYELDVVRTLRTSIVSMAGKGAAVYNGGGSAADLFVSNDLAVATGGDTTTQTFEFTAYGIHRGIGKMSEVEDKEDPQFMIWEINPVDYVQDGPDTFENVALEASGNTLKIAEDKDTAAQRFLILYSMNKDGGYLLVPVASENGIKAYQLDGESFSLADLSGDYKAEQAFWLAGCDEENVTANDDLTLIVKDVVVKESEVDGKKVYTIVEGADALNEYVFSNDFMADYDEYGVMYAETGSADDASTIYNKLVVGTLLSARIAEYGDLAPATIDGYEFVGYTYTNIVPDNEKNVCYRYFVSLNGDVEVSEPADESSADASADDSKPEASSEANPGTSSSDNTSDDGGNATMIIIIVVAVVVVIAVVAVILLKKKKQ